jgi:predicted  nucleic acid-binding Zn-ribbon protein
VLVEYPIEPTWTLVSPKEPAEKTRDLYRFRVETQPGKPVKLAVDEQRADRQLLALTNIDDSTIQFYTSAKVVSERVKAALAEVVKQKHVLEQVAIELGERQQQIRDIGEDQARIRQNMAQLDHNTDVYKNYVKKFSEQEAEIEKLRGQIAGLTARIAGLRRSLDEYLLGLDLQ